MDMRAQQRRGRRRLGGFTLIEMLVVVMIIGMLAAIVGYNLVGAGEEARKSAVHAQFKVIKDAAKLYKIKNGSFPSSMEQLAPLLDEHKVPEGYSIEAGEDTVVVTYVSGNLNLRSDQADAK